MISTRELIRFILHFLKRQRGAFGSILTLDSICWALDALIWPYILHLVIDIFTLYESDRMAAWGALQGPIIAGICLVIFVETSSRVMGFLMARAIPKLQEDLRMTMFDHIQRHSPHYFNERFAGSLANKITDMTTQVESILQQLFWPIIPAISTCILGSFFLWHVHPLFTWLLLGWTVVHLGTCLLYTRRCDQAEHLHAEARSSLLGKIVDSLTNNFAVNLFFRFNHERTRLLPLQQTETKTNQRARRIVEQTRCFLSLIYFGVGILGMFGTIIHLWLHGQITTGQVAQVFGTMWALAMILWTVGSALPVLFQSIGIAKQAYGLMLDPQDVADSPQAHELRVVSGQIVFDNVSFRYADTELFKNKHVQIPGGQKVGLVGFTGAGKSTFISLILRFYRLHQGKILIDSQDIAHVTLESLRRQIALIPQDPVLFHRTLRDNIAYGYPEASEEELLRAAGFAHCDEFIRRIPHGYEATVGERGTKLSGGEKQRIAIARAMLTNAPILILDEATSALDSVTERLIQESLGELMQNRTTLVIAHRLSTLSRMDRLLVFDKGQIVEDGTHVELLSKQGLYAKMWTMQVGGFLPDTPA